MNNTEELKTEFAEHLQVKELDTREGYAVEWTVKMLGGNEAIGALKLCKPYMDELQAENHTEIGAGLQYDIHLGKAYEAMQKALAVEWTVAAMSKSNEAIEWIDVKDDLPKDSGQVLGCMKDTLSIYVCFFKKSRNLFQVWGAGKDPISDMKVTHWMPLPQPPNKLFNEAGERK